MTTQSFKRRLTGFAVTGIAVVGLFGGTPAQAGSQLAGLADPPRVGVYYQIISHQTDECLDVWGASTDHAANVGVWRCAGLTAGNQLWSLQEADNGAFYIKVRHTGMCLNVANHGQLNGSDVVQATCSNGTNEQWRMLPVPGQAGYFWLVAEHSQKALDKAHNGDVVQWDRRKDSLAWWQQWRFGDTGISA